MTMKHVIEGLMQATKCKNHSQLSKLLDFPQGIICRLAQGKSKTLGMDNLLQVHTTTGVSIQTLFDWYRLPTGAVLGRVA